MTRSRPLCLGTRGSDLALWQARRVAGLISENLGTECEIEVITTKGDRIQNVAAPFLKRQYVVLTQDERDLFHVDIDGALS